jgi:dienelactone hydrolase
LPEQGPSLLQKLWERTPTDNVRQWSMAGPFEKATAPSADLKWISQRSWGDTVDVSDVLGIPSRLLDGRQVVSAFARVSITRKEPEAVVAMLGVDGEYELMVNGEAVYRKEQGEVFLPGRDVVPIHLKMGENEILLRLIHKGGPWRVALRVGDAAEIALSKPNLLANISTAGEQLVVATRGTRGLTAAPLSVDVVAPGGVVVAHGLAQAGKSVSFDARAWPEGPYEVRCEGADMWGEPHSAVLPWYKGDALKLARQLRDFAAGVPNGVEGDHLRMLGDLVSDRLGGNFQQAGPQAWQQIHSPLFEYLELKQAKAGHEGPVHPSGFVRLAYRDEVDGSTQFCRAYLPRHYDATRRWPLLVVLHGFNPGNPRYIHWWGVDVRHDDLAETQDVIVLEPLGRGNAQYAGIGEQDVLRSLAEASRMFSVDEDRVYLLGESMGGHGTWRIGSRNPDVFAALAPYFGGWDFGMVPPAAGGYAGIPASNSWETFARHSGSSFASLANLEHVPVYVSHGDSDPVVNVAFSRHAVRQLDRWGYTVRYEELPGMVHEDFRTRAKVVKWLLGQRRANAPRKVRLHAHDLGAAHAFWLSVDAFGEPGVAMDASAEFIQPGILRLDTSNVAGISLALPPSLSGSGELDLIWNGVGRKVKLVSGAARLSESGVAGGALRKSRGLEGPISSIITTPFIVVVGTTSPDPVTRELCRIKAEAFAAAWKSWQHVEPRTRNDVELGDEEKRKFSLILIGGPEANSVSREFRDQLPFRVSETSITIEKREWHVTDALLAAIYPNPVAANRYVLYVDGTSARGLAAWNPVLWAVPFGFGNVNCDWYISDGRRYSVSPGHYSPASFVAYGLMDANWHLDAKMSFAGDPARNDAPLPTTPVALRKGGDLKHPESEVPARFLGTYELFPGVKFQFSNREGAAFVELPDGGTARLLKESDHEFLVLESGTQIHFDPSGSGPAIAVLNTNGEEIRLRQVTLPQVH